MKKHLTGLAEWSSPEAGMFFWYISLFLKTDLPGLTFFFFFFS